MKSQFSRLYKTIMENVNKPSRRHLNKIIKEDSTPESITPEQRAIIEKVVAKLCAEKEDYKNTVEFAQLDTDFFVALLDGCYEDWLRDEGFDDEQPDMFDEKPGFEEFAYDTIEYYLLDYDADNENTADDIWDNLSELEEKLYWTDMVAELKPQLEAFKAACKKLIDKEGDDTYYLDYALRDTDWWDENGLKYSPELGLEIKRYKRFFNWTLDHCFASDDYNGWLDPDGLLERLGLEDWYHDEDKDTPDLFESKKVNTRKAIIKEDWDVEYEKYDGYMNNHEKTLIGLLKKNDPSKVSQAMIAACEKKGVEKSKFYKWNNAMCTAQFNCLDKVEWWKENGFTISPEEEKEINWYNWITQKLIDHQRLACDWELQDWTKEILEQGGAQEFLDYVDQLDKADRAALKADRVERATTYQTPMYDDAAETDSLHESKKVDNSKKVIKESAKDLAKRIRSKRVIKESAPVKKHVKKIRK